MGLGIRNWIRPSKCCSRSSVGPELLALVGVGLGIFVRRDIVDVEIVVFGVERSPILVGVVETRHRPLLDRTARLVALLLRLALVLRRRIGAEVAVARGRF